MICNHDFHISFGHIFVVCFEVWFDIFFRKCVGIKPPYHTPHTHPYTHPHTHPQMYLASLEKIQNWKKKITPSKQFICGTGNKKNMWYSTVLFLFLIETYTLYTFAESYTLLQNHILWHSYSCNNLSPYPLLMGGVLTYQGIQGCATILGQLFARNP